MSKEDYWIEFELGTKQLAEGRLKTIAALIYGTIGLLSHLTKVSPTRYWAVVDSFGRKFRVKSIQQIVLSSPHLLTERINNELDNAVIEYNKEVPEEKTPEPIWIDEVDGETALGGSLGFSYDFVVDLEDNKEED